MCQKNEFFFLFLLWLNETRRLGESKILSVCFWFYLVGMGKGGKLKILFCYPRGLRASTHKYQQRGVVIYIVGGVFVDY